MGQLWLLSVHQLLKSWRKVTLLKMGIHEVTLLENLKMKIGILISKRVTSWNSHLNFWRYHFALEVTISYA